MALAFMHGARRCQSRLSVCRRASVGKGKRAQRGPRFSLAELDGPERPTLSSRRLDWGRGGDSTGELGHPIMDSGRHPQQRASLAAGDVCLSLFF